MPDVLWTCIIGSDRDECSYEDSKAEITLYNDYLYLGSRTDKQTTTKYPIVGVSPTYTQAANGTTWDGSISRFILNNIHYSDAIGIKEINGLNGDLNVFPNPSNYDLNLKITNFNKVSSYNIYNSLGQIVLSGRIENINTIINISTLKTGMYFIEVNDGKERKSAKFIKSE